MPQPPKRPASRQPSAPPKVRRKSPRDDQPRSRDNAPRPDRRPFSEKDQPRDRRDAPRAEQPRVQRKSQHSAPPRKPATRRDETNPQSRAPFANYKPTGPRPTSRDFPSRKPARSVRYRGKETSGSGSGGLFPELRAALCAIFAEGKRLDKVIEGTLHTRRRLWTEEERSRFVTIMHDITRNWRARWIAAGLPDADCTKPAAITDDAVREVLRPNPAPPKGLTPAMSASFPDWLWHRTSTEIGKEWPRLAEDLAKPAPLFLRVNNLRTDARKLAASLADDDIPTVPGAGGSLRVDHRDGFRDVFATAAFHSGLFEVQDAGSQVIAPLLEVEPGMRVIDACAGAGGKSLQLAALMNNKGRIIALDIHEWKLGELRKRAARAGVDNLETRLLDHPRVLKKMAASADRVLLDVPCSGLGVLRRHPDRKWHLNNAELTRLIALQAQLLADFAPTVKPGGVLLYATCSILPSENQQQVRAFLTAHPGWIMQTERVLWPSGTGGDAFYAARLVAPAGI